MSRIICSGNALTYPSCLPEEAPKACAIIEKARKLCFDVGACTDRQQHYCQESFKIKQSRHFGQRPFALISISEAQLLDAVHAPTHIRSLSTTLYIAMSIMSWFTAYVAGERRKCLQA